VTSRPAAWYSPRAMLSRRAAWTIGAAKAVTAALVALGVFAGLPARWWPVDVPAAVLVALEAAAAFGLFSGARWAANAARFGAAVALALGALAVSCLAVTATWLSGVYGAVGRGGAIVLALVAALVLPYLVVLPAAQLLWLGSSGRRAASGRS